MISFEPTEDQRLIQETVGELAKTTLAPRAREFEAAREVADDVQQVIGEMGLALAAVPEAHGGQELGLLTAVLINEGLSRGDSATPFGLHGFGPYVWAAQELASSDQLTDLLTPLAAGKPGGAVAWSEVKARKDRAAFVTTASKSGDGYTLSGSKCFVGGVAAADRFIVFADVEGEATDAPWSGSGAFVVKRDAPGLKLGKRHETLGLACADFGRLELDGVDVNEADRLRGGDDFVAATLRFFARYSLTVAARQVGLCKSSFDITRDYCDIREAFGKPIGHFQAVAFTLADRHMDAESAGELCRRAAWAWDARKPFETCLAYTAQAVAHAHEAAMRCGDDAVQLHGGAGFMRDVIVEKMMRDAKQTALVGMTAEQMDQVAALVACRAKLTPELVLPTPDAQAILT